MTSPLFRSEVETGAGALVMKAGGHGPEGADCISPGLTLALRTAPVRPLFPASVRQIQLALEHAMDATADVQLS